MNKALAWLVTPLLLGCVHLAEAQQGVGKLARIGYSGIDQSPSALPREKVFVQRLANTHG
jgi:hypothetical protein